MYTRGTAGDLHRKPSRVSVTLGVSGMASTHTHKYSTKALGAREQLGLRRSPRYRHQAVGPSRAWGSSTFLKILQNCRHMGHWGGLWRQGDSPITKTSWGAEPEQTPEHPTASVLSEPREVRDSACPPLGQEHFRQREQPV